ncbi:phytoene dehydrogenase [Aspergillus steynii IBT 23096]|uniref:Phytoene desaturase n=1 Tax=Aspergillus steynii IBT 23096 TaxID=1392250 RepID=A0A2I2GJZ7_9EURO|nr:phytoene dehydrogenase [Aspergillus steynii IBT 23096]PLB53208.1 phytoene dehydrogenase [Aspergillus steynii IBT 23096]
MESKSTAPTAVVVGAGAGGVAVAARLAKKGFQVTVVEKNASIGGRCSTLEDEGFRFDQGPSLLLMPEFFHEVFHDLDTSMEAEGLRLVQCDQNYRIWFTDHQPLDLSCDMAHMNRELTRLEGPAGFEKFLAFLAESARHYRLSCRYVLRANFARVWNMLRPGLVASLGALHPFESLYSRVSRYFESEELRRAFTFASMYLGMSPFDAPATYSLLQYAEFVDGVWYPIGGFQTVLEAIGKIGSRLGVEYRFNAPVASVRLSDDRKTACGVVLDSDEIIDADVVIVNADLIYAYNNLLPDSRFARTLKTRGTSCSSISFFWSFNTTLPALQSHNVFLGKEYRQSFDALFKQDRIPEEPSFYVHVPSRLDSSAAPEGMDALVVLVPVGHLGDEDDSLTDWAAVVEKTKEKVLRAIEERTGMTNLRDKLIKERVETPVTWKQKYNLDRGAILGISHSFFNVLCFRPKTKHTEIEGLFFVGASTHPGTGVPVCLAGSKIVAEQVVQMLVELVDACPGGGVVGVDVAADLGKLKYLH